MYVVWERGLDIAEIAIICLALIHRVETSLHLQTEEAFSF